MGSSHFFEPLAEHAGAAYLRYSFTKGTAQEVDFLVETLGLAPGMQVLDVGCGPGRHAHELGRRGIEVIGLDIAERFVRLATDEGVAHTRFVRGDALRLPFAGAFDAAISLCQGGFGLVLGADGDVLTEMAQAVKPGGLVCVSAFSAYFAVRYLEDSDDFDAGRGVNHERATVKNDAGEEADFDLWTTCFTPRELRLLAERAGLAVRDLWAVTPGKYGPNRPDLDHPEFLLVAQRPRP